MPTKVIEGTTSLTSTTETTLDAAQTVDGNYVLKLDLHNMVNGQELEVRIYDKVKTASAEAVVYYGFYAHVQAEPVVVSIPVPSTESWKATIKKTAGANLDVDWVIILI